MVEDQTKPKIRRGPRACNNCRKGKNRCDGADNPPCLRCQNQGVECIFEQPVKQAATEEERLAAVETSCRTLHFKVDQVLQLLLANQITNQQQHQHRPMDSPFVPQFGVLPGVNLPVPHSQPPLLHQAGRPDTSTDSSINGHLNFSMPSASAHLPPPPQASAPSIISPTPASQPNPPSHAQQAISPWTPMPFGNPPMPMSSTNTEDPSLTHHSPASSSSTLQNGLGRKRMRMSTGNSSIMTYPAPRQQQPPLPSVPPLVQNASFRNTSQHAEASTSRKRPAPQQWPDSTIPSASRSSTGGSGVKSEDSPPAGGTIVQPFEALADAAALAAEGAPDPLSRSRTPVNGEVELLPQRTTQRNSCGIRDVVSKGLIPDAAARDLYRFYHEELSGFIAILDYQDPYELVRETNPATFNAVMAIACRRHHNSDAVPRDIKAACRREAEENARATLFGLNPTRDIVQAVTLLSAWSFDHTYVTTGHALRLALQLRMHQALGQLQRMSAEQDAPLPDREVVIAARTWLLLGWLDWQVSLGTGRPLNPHHEDGPLTSAKYNALLEHPASLSGDIKLVSNNILMYHMHAISEATFDPPSETLQFVKETNVQLEDWYNSWNRAFEARQATFHQSSIKRQLYEAKTFLSARALEKASLLAADEMQALVNLSVEACMSVLDACIKPKDSQDYSLWLRWASTPNFVEIAWGGIWVLQVLKLCPALDRSRTDQVLAKVQELATVMETWPAKRYALTLKIALERFHKAQSASVDEDQDIADAPAIIQDYDLNDLLSSSPDQWASTPGYAWLSGLFGNQSTSTPLHSYEAIQAWQGQAPPGHLFSAAW